MRLSWRSLSHAKWETVNRIKWVLEFTMEGDERWILYRSFFPTSSTPHRTGARRRAKYESWKLSRPTNKLLEWCNTCKQRCHRLWEVKTKILYLWEKLRVSYEWSLLRCLEKDWTPRKLCEWESWWILDITISFMETVFLRVEIRDL